MSRAAADGKPDCGQTCSVLPHLQVKRALPAEASYGSHHGVGEPPDNGEEGADVVEDQHYPSVCGKQKVLVLSGRNMNREKLLFEELHEALQLSNDKNWLECCHGFADLGDPQAPDSDVDLNDDVGMSVEELEKQLAEGKRRDCNAAVRVHMVLVAAFSCATCGASSFFTPPKHCAHHRDVPLQWRRSPGESL